MTGYSTSATQLIGDNLCFRRKSGRVADITTMAGFGPYSDIGLHAANSIQND